jgi:hypothetical protein
VGEQIAELSQILTGERALNRGSNRPSDHKGIESALARAQANATMPLHPHPNLARLGQSPGAGPTPVPNTLPAAGPGAPPARHSSQPAPVAFGASTAEPISSTNRVPMRPSRSLAIVFVGLLVTGGALAVVALTRRPTASIAHDSGGASAAWEPAAPASTPPAVASAAPPAPSAATTIAPSGTAQTSATDAAPPPIAPSVVAPRDTHRHVPVKPASTAPAASATTPRGDPFDTQK